MLDADVNFVLLTVITVKGAYGTGYAVLGATVVSTITLVLV
jgi:hypothetical protein